MKFKNIECYKSNIFELLENKFNSNPNLFTNDVYQKLKEVFDLINRGGQMSKGDKNFLIWLLKNISLSHSEWKDEIEAMLKKIN